MLTLDSNRSIRKVCGSSGFANLTRRQTLFIFGVSAIHIYPTLDPKCINFSCTTTVALVVPEKLLSLHRSRQRNLHHGHHRGHHLRCLLLQANRLFDFHDSTESTTKMSWASPLLYPTTAPCSTICSPTSRRLLSCSHLQNPSVQISLVPLLYTLSLSIVVKSVVNS